MLPARLEAIVVVHHQGRMDVPGAGIALRYDKQIARLESERFGTFRVRRQRHLTSYYE